MRLPIDTGAVKFAAAGPAEPVLDFETRVPKLDEKGVPIFSVLLFAAGTGIKDPTTFGFGIGRMSRRQVPQNSICCNKSDRKQPMTVRTR